MTILLVIYRARVSQEGSDRKGGIIFRPYWFHTFVNVQQVKKVPLRGRMGFLQALECTGMVQV